MAASQTPGKPEVTERELLAAQAHNASLLAKAGKGADPVAREEALRTQAKITAELARVRSSGPAPVSNQGMVRDVDLEPGDPGPPIEKKEGLLGRGLPSRENPYTKQDLKADALKIGEIASPVFKGVRSHLKTSEAEALAQTKKEQGSGASPEGGEMSLEQLKAALASQSPRVVGYTKGGFQPSAKGGTVRKEEKILPPEYYESVRRFGEYSEDAAAGGVLEQSAVAEAAAQGADRRAQAAEDFRVGTEQAANEEAATLARGRDRIQSAIDAYMEAGPRYESLGTVLKEAPAGKGVLGGIGLILGALGSSSTGREGNPFTDAVNQNINRRAKIAEEESKKAGVKISMEGAQYAKVERAIGDAQASRALIKAMYLDEYAESLKAHMGRIGIGFENPKLQFALAEIEKQKALLMEKAAGVVMQQASHEEKYAPPKAIMAKAANAGLSKDQLERMDKYTEERRKRGMDVMEGGIRLMRNGAKQITSEKPNAAQSLLFRQVLADPGNWATASSVFGQLTPGQQTTINGFLQVLNSDAGKQLTKDERAGVASGFAKADPSAINNAVGNFQTRLDALDRGLVPAYGDAIQNYRILQQIDDLENPRKLYDVQGIETQPPVTERPPVAPKE